MAATRIFSRSLLTKLTLLNPSPSFPLRPICFRALSTLSPRSFLFPVSTLAIRGLATRTTSSSLNDPNPNWSNRPPKETILLDGCDFEHWLVVMEKPEGDPTRDEIIDSYIKTLAMVVGSEEEARMKLYSVSTRHYFAFGALVSEELSYKIKELPRVRWVLPDSYLDVRNKDYGGEPVINGVPVPYDPKYHEEWVRNNARANERNRRNDRPRNNDRSRNFERRRENMQTRDNMGPPSGPPGNMSGPPLSNMGPPQQGNVSGPPPPGNMGRMPSSNTGYQPNNAGGYQPSNMGGFRPNNSGGYQPNNTSDYQPNNQGGYPPNNAVGGGYQNNMGGMPPLNNMGGTPPQSNMGGMPPNNMGNYQNRGYSNNAGSPPKEHFQNSYAQNSGEVSAGGNVYQK